MRFHGLGGDLMAAAGTDLRAHLRDTAVMGLTEVLGALPRVLKVRSGLCRLIESDPPDCLVLIDSPDLNFRLARSAWRAGVPVVYYICPQIWAWRQGRLAFLRDRVSRRAVILPFEAAFYQDRGVTCDPVGHPLLDELPAGGFDRALALSDLGLAPERPDGPDHPDHGAPGPAGPRDPMILAVLPGSRRSVAARLLGPMLEAVGLLLEEFPSLVAVLPRSPAVPAELVEAAAARARPAVREALKIVPGSSSQRLLSVCRAALLASGTSTVEGAILGAPMVVTYRTSALSWFLAKLLVRTPYVAIANLVAGREVVRELLQGAGSPEALAGALAPLLRGGPERDAMTRDLGAVAAALGGPGASRRVLDVIDEEVDAARARR
jgi:lipid-A-disaccharide synthase